MEYSSKKEQVTSGEPNNSVHHILAHSYSFYLLLFLLSFFLDLVFPIKIFNSSVMAYVGFVFLTLSSFLIIWAQKTSRNLKKEEIKSENFYRGPYCYTRSPTHWGLFLLMFGFGITINALFVILATVIAFIVTKFVFLRKEELILADKYGAPYLEYKKLVRF